MTQEQAFSWCACLHLSAVDWRADGCISMLGMVMDATGVQAPMPGQPHLGPYCGGTSLSVLLMLASSPDMPLCLADIRSGDAVCGPAIWNQLTATVVPCYGGAARLAACSWQGTGVALVVPSPAPAAARRVRLPSPRGVSSLSAPLETRMSRQLGAVAGPGMRALPHWMLRWVGDALRHVGVAVVLPAMECGLWSQE